MRIERSVRFLEERGSMILIITKRIKEGDE